MLHTPATTEGETATETELETETEMEEEHTRVLETSKPKHQLPLASAATDALRYKKKQRISQHDLLNRYFRRDVVVFRNIDLLRYVRSSMYLLLG